LRAGRITEVQALSQTLPIKGRQEKAGLLSIKKHYRFYQIQRGSEIIMKPAMNKIILIGLISLSFFSADYCAGATGAGFSITGAVRQPLQVTAGDLAKYQSVQVQLNEVLSDGGFHGSFTYQGVPLKTLLELA
jgi:hypothetical protein